MVHQTANGFLFIVIIAEV